jgi:hypothetical protein
MPQYTARIFVCLAVFALAVATGAEAVVCGANQYLKMDGLYAGTVKNGPKCVACPTGMSNPAGVAGGYGDSANPNLAVILASKVAATAANSDLLTWCDVDAGYFLTTDSSATIPGVATICPNTRIAGSRITTSIKQSIIGITTDAAADVKGDVACTVKSTCAAGKYLKTTVSGGASTAGCFACPTGMSSAAGSTLPVFAGGKAELAHTTGRTAAVLYTFCDVDTGYYQTTASSAITPGAVTACSSTSTRSLGRSIQAHATGTVQAENVVCVVEKITSGPAGPAGPGGTAGTASPAAPLSTITAAVFGAVVPAILILV